MFFTDFNPMSPDTGILTFDVFRREDVSGTSGNGVVAMGAVFPDGTTVIQWQTHVRSVVVYTSMAPRHPRHPHHRRPPCPERCRMSGQWFGGYRVLPMAGAPSPTRVSPSTKAKRRAANRAARKQRRANRRG